MIVLDTHVWIWTISDPDRLSSAAAKAIVEEPDIYVAAISCWEFALLVQKERISVSIGTLEWLHGALGPSGIQLAPLTPAIAVAAYQLNSDFPGDPADRLIAATAKVHSAKLITKDASIQQFGGVSCIW